MSYQLVTDGLVAKWDASTWSSGTTWTDSINNKVITFSSAPASKTSDGIELTTSITFTSASLSSLGLSQPCTFEWLGRIDGTFSSSAPGNVFGLNSTSGAWSGGILCYSKTSSNGVQLDIGSSGAITSKVYTSGIEYHIIVTVSSNTTTLYVNSTTAKGTSTKSAGYGNKYYLYNNEGSGRFYGAIQRMCLWNKCLSSTEISMLFTEETTTYTATSTTSTGGTISPLGATTVTEGGSVTYTLTPEDGYELSSFTVDGVSKAPTEVASSGLDGGVCLLQNNLTDVLGLSTVSTSGVTTTTAYSKFGGTSFYFNGSSYMTITLPSDTKPCTLEMWIYPTVANTSGLYSTIFSTNAYSAAGGTYMHMDDGSYSTYPVCRANGSSSSSNTGGYGSTVITRNSWHHIAMCYDGSSKHYFFIDGVLQYTVTQSSPNSYQYWYIGALMGASSVSSGTYFTGYMDEILVSDSCKWTSDFSVPTAAYSTSSSTYYTYTVSNITDDITVNVIYTKGGTYYTITSSIENGTITSTNPQTIAEGGSTTISFNGSTGYNFKSMTVNGSAVTPTKNTSTSSATWSVSTNYSTYSTYALSNINDSSTSTYFWSSEAQATGKYILITFSSLVTLNSFNTYSSSSTDYPHSCNELQVSTDGKTWSTIGTFSNSTTSSFNNLNVTNIKYVRIYATSSISNWLVINEITMSYTTNEIATYSYSLSNIAEDKTVIIIFEASNIVYIKVSGSWVAATNVYKKVSGTWVLQTISSTLFDADTDYALNE